jgi:hypothetical protein|tara:strand:- start:235 stop:609 length:375 start_codon:yes stop_codon:yes gene_type:complete
MQHDSDKAANDYNYSRETYYDLIEKGKSALDDMIEVARESEHPRAFEVLSGMIKNISDVNDRLMILNKGKKDLERNNDTTEVNNTQNNFYLGSTADVQRLLKGDLIDVTDDAPKSIEGDVSRKS